MKKTSLFLASAAAGMMVLGVAAADKAQAQEKEKCYGVAKAGKNDCAAPNHSCAGQAEKDAVGSDWVYVPKGLCERLAGGSMSPAAGHSDK